MQVKLKQQQMTTKIKGSNILSPTKNKILSSKQKKLTLLQTQTQDLIPQQLQQHTSDNISSDSVSIINQQSQLKPPAFQKHTYSYFMLIVSCFLFVSGFIYANQNNMSPFQTSISRYTFMFFVTYAHCRYEGSPLVYFNRPHEGTLLFRNVIVALHGFVITIMQFYLPLGMFHTLIISGQIFVFLANYFLKGVKITKNQAIGVGVSFIGLGLIINGRLIYEHFLSSQSQFHTDFTNYYATDTYIQIKMACLYVLWNAIWSLSVVLTKIPQYSGGEILFTQTVTSMIFSAIGYLFFNVQQRVTLQVYLPSLIFCGMIMIANYLFTYGIMWSQNTGIATMMLMSSAVFGYFISIFRYNQQLNAISLFGTVVLVASAGYVVWEQQKVKN